MPVGYEGSVWRYGIDHKVGGLDDLLRVRILDLEVEAEGDVDVHGTLAMDPAVRVGFRSIRTQVHLRAAPDTPERLIGILIEHAEKLSVCLDTVRNGSPVDVEFDVRTGEPAPATP